MRGADRGPADRLPQVVDGEAARPIDSTIQAARTAADDIVERLVELAEQRGDDLYEVGGSVVGSVE